MTSIHLVGPRLGFRVLRGIGLFAPMLGFALATPAGAQVREREPNDSLAQPPVLRPGVTTVSGSIAAPAPAAAGSELVTASPDPHGRVESADRGDLDFFVFTGLPAGGTFTARTGIPSTLGRYVNEVLVAFGDGRRGLSGQVPASGRVVLAVGGLDLESGRADVAVLSGTASRPVGDYALSVAAKRRSWFTPPPITPAW